MREGDIGRVPMPTSQTKLIEGRRLALKCLLWVWVASVTPKLIVGLQKLIILSQAGRVSLTLRTGCLKGG